MYKSDFEEIRKRMAAQDLVDIVEELAENGSIELEDDPEDPEDEDFDNEGDRERAELIEEAQEAQEKDEKYPGARKAKEGK